MPSCVRITEVYVACTQDTLVNADEDGTSPASTRVSFEVDFRWHATETCMVGPGSTACVDRMKVHSDITYKLNECGCSAISTASSSPRNRFCRGLLCLAHRGISKG